MADAFSVPFILSWGRLIIEAFEKKEKIFFSLKKKPAAGKKLTKLFIHSPVINLLCFDPTIRDSNQERSFTGYNPESATKWVAALCLQRPFSHLVDTTYSKREKMRLSLLAPSKQCSFAVRATSKKQKQTQLWIEGGGKRLGCFVVWYVSHKTIVSYKFCRSLRPGFALGEKGEKSTWAKKKSASEVSREVVWGGERVARRYFSYLNPVFSFCPPLQSLVPGYSVADYQFWCKLKITIEKTAAATYLWDRHPIPQHVDTACTRYTSHSTAWLLHLWPSSPRCPLHCFPSCPHYPRHVHCTQTSDAVCNLFHCWRVLPADSYPWSSPEDRFPVIHLAIVRHNPGHLVERMTKAPLHSP